MSEENVTADFLPCPCCGARVLTSVGLYEICAVCSWEDDPSQSANSDLAGGANELSLNQVRDKQRKNN